MTVIGWLGNPWPPSQRSIIKHYAGDPYDERGEQPRQVSEELMDKLMFSDDDGTTL
jgi:hypothetical protein